ncbi:MAG: transcription repressor NadR [Tissierellaceae bacterium]|nr:transcription repressor NadR [Tissierellaceae bacterium]
MDANERREEIIRTLKMAQGPIKGTDLSEKLKVSRQVIVQDIAILRAKGEDILATPQGYIIPKPFKGKAITRTIACVHQSNKEIEDELKTIVDLGGRIIDVIVEHPLYGEIKSQLQIGSRHDLELFMDSLEKTNAEPLSSLTGGVHLHTIEVEDEKALERIKNALLGKNYLIKED